MKSIGIKSLVLLLVAALSFFVFLPPEQNERASDSAPVSVGGELCSAVSAEEDVKISSRLWELLFGKDNEGNNAPSNERVSLIVGGGIFGARIKQSYVSVSDPMDTAELKVGDRIISADGEKISCPADIKKIVKDSGGCEINLVCLRNGKTMNVKLTPKEVDGEYKLGVVLKDGTAGIGTVTYIDPKTGCFGGLGHGICDTETGELVEMNTGEVTNVILGGVKKGETGKPGELSGILTDKVTGTLTANTDCGVFGRLDRIPQGLETQTLEIAHRDEVHTGEATILSTVKMGARREFKIEITEINKTSTGTKSFKIKVTDPALIAITGGVVRGMSGSPIIQGGKLIGAVTHVMVADPTEGYGIFIENMLSAAESQAMPKAA